jgi:secreted Zn-dependent insulinase-like peptidase
MKDCGKNHPYLKFSTGNSTTLAIEKGTLAAVAAFHKQHYFPANMSACVLGSASLDEVGNPFCWRQQFLPSRGMMEEHV